jgi:hypothetical protein
VIAECPFYGSFKKKIPVAKGFASAKSTGLPKQKKADRLPACQPRAIGLKNRITLLFVCVGFFGFTIYDGGCRLTPQS